MPDDAFDEVQDMILEDAGKIFSPRLIELFMAPKNFGVLADFDHYSVIEGACGETVVMYLAVREGQIDRISFVADACGPTLACSSAVTCMAKGYPSPKPPNHQSRSHRLPRGTTRAQRAMRAGSHKSPAERPRKGTALSALTPQKDFERLVAHPNVFLCTDLHR